MIGTSVFSTARTRRRKRAFIPRVQKELLLGFVCEYKVWAFDSALSPVRNLQIVISGFFFSKNANLVKL